MIKTLYVAYGILISTLISFAVIDALAGDWPLFGFQLLLILFNLNFAKSMIHKEKSRNRNRIMKAEGDRYDVDSDPAF